MEVKKELKLSTPEVHAHMQAEGLLAQRGAGRTAPRALLPSLTGAASSSAGAGSSEPGEMGGRLPRRPHGTKYWSLLPTAFASRDQALTYIKDNTNVRTRQYGTSSNTGPASYRCTTHVNCLKCWHFLPSENSPLWEVWESRDDHSTVAAAPPPERPGVDPAARHDVLEALAAGRGAAAALNNLSLRKPAQMTNVTCRQIANLSNYTGQLVCLVKCPCFFGTIPLCIS